VRIADGDSLTPGNHETFRISLAERAASGIQGAVHLRQVQTSQSKINQDPLIDPLAGLVSIVTWRKCFWIACRRSAMMPSYDMP
jgi:hypothetical protein